MPEIIVKLGDNIVQKYFFVKEPMRIGRAPDNEIVIENLAISRGHAVIQWKDGRYYVEDLDSSNGTFVNGVRMNKTEIMDRDVISIGKHKLHFYDQHQRKQESALRATMSDVDRTMMVDMAPPRAELEVLRGRQKGQSFTLDAAVTTLGRGADCDIRVTDWFVSRNHAAIERQGNSFIIRDLDSWRHTMVNGVAINESPLAHGDKIQLGPSVQLAFTVQIPDQVAEARQAMRMPIELGVRGHARPYEDQESSDLDGMDYAVDLDGGALSLEDVFPTADEQELQPECVANVDCGQEHEQEHIRDDEQDHEQVHENHRQGCPCHEELNELPEQEFAQECPDACEDANEHEHEHGMDGLPEIKAAMSPAGAVMESIAQATLQAAAAVIDRETAQAGELQIENCGVSDPEEAERLGALNEAIRVNSRDTSDPGVNGEEIRMWERALQNKSPIIRKQAARRLKQITGRDYEY